MSGEKKKGRGAGRRGGGGHDGGREVIKDCEVKH